MRNSLTRLLLSTPLVLVAACGNKNNSAATDEAAEDLRKAQAAVAATSTDLTKNQEQLEQQKRDLLREQQALADRQKVVEQQQQQLGQARGNLTEARVAYAAAVTERLAKLDASLATLTTKTDPTSKDAATGIRARRDQLAKNIDAMASTTDLDWNPYTQGVDTTFDAIERDLAEAAN